MDDERVVRVDDEREVRVDDDREVRVDDEMEVRVDDDVLIDGREMPDDELDVDLRTELLGFDVAGLLGEDVVLVVSEVSLGESVGSFSSSVSVSVSGVSLIGSTVGALFIDFIGTASCCFLKACSFSHFARSDTLICSSSSSSGFVSSGSGCFLPNAAPLCINFILSATLRFSGSTSAGSGSLLVSASSALSLLVSFFLLNASF